MYRPQRGACLHPPHRLAEGSGPSGAHTTQRIEWSFPNRAACSPHTFLTRTAVILSRRRRLRAMELTVLDLMFAVFQADAVESKRGALREPAVPIKSL